MKRILTLLAIIPMLMTAVISCSAQNRLLKDASSIKDVTSVYVGKTMLSIGNRALPGDSYGVQDLISDLNAIEVVNTESKSAAIQLRKIANDIVSGHNCEILTEVNDSEGKEIDITRIFTISPSGNNNFEGILIEADEGNEYSLIFMNGKINLEKIANATDE